MLHLVNYIIVATFLLVMTLVVCAVRPGLTAVVVAAAAVPVPAADGRDEDALRPLQRLARLGPLRRGQRVGGRTQVGQVFSHVARLKQRRYLYGREWLLPVWQGIVVTCMAVNVCYLYVRECLLPVCQSMFVTCMSVNVCYLYVRECLLPVCQSMFVTCMSVNVCYLYVSDCLLPVWQ